MNEIRSVILACLGVLLASGVGAQTPDYPRLEIISQFRTATLELQAEGGQPEHELTYHDAASENEPFVRTYLGSVTGDQGTAASGSTTHNSILGTFGIAASGGAAASIATDGFGAFAIADASALVQVQFTVPVDAAFVLSGSLAAGSSGPFAVGRASVQVIGTHADGTTYDLTESVTSQDGNAPLPVEMSLTVQAGSVVILGINTHAGGILNNPSADSAWSSFDLALDFGDRDVDGLLDVWEIEGIDVDGDAIPEIDLPALGADPDRRDIFVEIDAMTDVRVDPLALEMVERAFDSAPAAAAANPDGSAGFALHLLVDETDLPAVGLPADPWPAAFDQLKQDHFGTRDDRDHPEAAALLATRALIFRYCLWSESLDLPTGPSTGLAETPGDDLIVAAGYVDAEALDVPRTLAGVLMHELGHTLGLSHGGEDDVAFKPNYLSVMNPAYQFPFRGSEAIWVLDYSRNLLESLSEASLLETAGLDGPGGKMVMYNSAPDGEPPVRTLEPADVAAIDWNQDGTIAYQPIAQDINRLLPGAPVVADEVHAGSVDWTHLWLHLSGHPNHGVERDLETVTPELSHAEIEAIEATEVVDLTGGVAVTDQMPGLAGYTLEAATPNPFNPATTLAFTIPRPGPVTLRVHDVAGRLVRVLLAGERLERGRHARRWDGTDRDGRPVASGVYLYQLTAGTYRATRAATLIK